MSTESLTLPLEHVVWRPKVNPWAIAATVSIAAFVEVLDTSVANVALPYIAGGLGASYDDSTWVLTSYLAANAIVLPISGWLAEMIGRKRYFMMSLTIFTISSLLCGLAPSLPLLLFFRALQGIGGGGLQPMAQAILNDTFPPGSAARRLPSMALPQFSLLPSGLCWEAGLLTATPGAGYFSSRCPPSSSLFI